MKKFTIFCMLVFATVAMAQVTTVPSPILKGYDGEITIVFNPNQGNKGMADATQCFAHTGLITSESTGGWDWKYVIDDWRGNSTKGQLTKDGDNWKLVIPNIYEFYGCPTNTEIMQLAFVFHDGPGGNLEGKTNTAGDIFVTLVDEIIEEAPYLVVEKTSETEAQVLAALPGHPADVVIPNTVTLDAKTYKLTAIAPNAFAGNETMTSVTLGENIRTIGEQAFSGCTALEKQVVIPNSVTEMGRSVFLRSPKIPSVVIGDGVKRIEENTFAECTALTSISLGKNVQYIGYYAFAYCQKLKAIVVPKLLVTIENYAFDGCVALESIVVEEGNAVFDSRNNCNAIITTASNTLKLGCKNTVIPNSVTHIGDAAFYNCYGLEKIAIPASVTHIGELAFYTCFNLKAIELPTNLLSLGTNAFGNCYMLESLVIPQSVTSIGENLFSNCYALESLVVEAGNAVYDSRNNCNAIIHTATNELVAGCNTTIIPQDIKRIGAGAMMGCRSLKELVLPQGLKSIGRAAFTNCHDLASISLPESIEWLGAYAFENTAYSNDISHWENGVLYLGKYLLQNRWQELPNEYVIKEGTRIIADNAFVGSQITSVSIPNTVETIGELAFCYSNLTELTIPASVKRIGDWAFDACWLNSVTCHALVPPTMGGEGVFMSYEVGLQVPCPSVADYKAHAVWGLFADIQCIPGTEVESGVENTLSDAPATNGQKSLHNGQLVIVRDGKWYNMAGQEVK